MAMQYELGREKNKVLSHWWVEEFFCYGWFQGQRYYLFGCW